MEVVNKRAAMLSNYEVLSWLRELESDHLSRTKTALRVKKEEETAISLSGSASASSSLGIGAHLEASENLRTVEVEAISYLSSDYLATGSQTEDGMTKLLNNLATYELTKAEKLQIVNLMPTLPVELYVIIEELEDRFGQQIEEILDKVKDSISTLAQDIDHIEIHGQSASQVLDESSLIVTEVEQWDEDADADAIYDEEYFDDDGTGAGVEGDLEMEED